MVGRQKKQTGFSSVLNIFGQAKNYLRSKIKRIQLMTDWTCVGEWA